MIEVRKLTQTYRSGKGIFDVDFRVEQGEVFGYLGPNGAGKTTTIRNLLGFANPDQGSAYINGFDCRKNAALLQNDIGYLPGEMAFLENMTGIEFVKFMGNMRKMKDHKRRDMLLERFDLDVDSKIKKMSKGMKQKLGIIVAFMHDPKVYILDEPTSGLDPLMQSVFMNLIEEEKKRGKTILMSSHIFEEIQRSSDRAGIIRDGRIVALEDVNALRLMSSKHYIIWVEDAESADRLMKSSYKSELLEPKKVKLSIEKPYQSFFELLSTCHISNFEIQQDSLEDVFMKYYGKEGASHE